jgi:glycerol uptake facilitator-like aquaporin
MPRRSPDAGLTRRIVAEGLGTGLLVAAVVGAGAMADRLAADPAAALIANTLTAGAILVVLITLFRPISGAHLNPAVSLVFALRREIAPREAGLYALAQVAGAAAGTLLAHAMFALPVVEFSRTVRTGGPQWLAEAVATFGLVLVILGALRVRPAALPGLVGLYIASAYWFTASTSFANPAVTLGRALTPSFAGIRPADVPAFVAAQLAGALIAMALAGWLWTDAPPRGRPGPPHAET